ncbi:MAG: hypothetical protein ACTSQ3_01420 [Candidatus Heimdallarchaeota archaeon]
MNVKALTITVFFTVILLFYQIKLILRLRNLRKIKGNLTRKGYFLEILFSSLGRCDCIDDACCRASACIGSEVDEVYEAYQEKRDQKQSDEFERKNAEIRKREQKEYVAKLEQEKIERKKRVEVLRTSGYTATDKERNKVIEIVSINPKTGLSWTSKTSRLQMEKIIIIIEHEPDFEIKGEYIINKKKIQEKEEKIKIAKITCPNCENLFELGSDFCPNCGDTLET